MSCGRNSTIVVTKDGATTACEASGHAATDFSLLGSDRKRCWTICGASMYYPVVAANKRTGRSSRRSRRYGHARVKKFNQSRPARPEEYETLKRELESPLHNYRLRVMKRLAVGQT